MAVGTPAAVVVAAAVDSGQYSDTASHLPWTDWMDGEHALARPFAVDPKRSAYINKNINKLIFNIMIHRL